MLLVQRFANDFSSPREKHVLGGHLKRRKRGAAKNNGYVFKDLLGLKEPVHSKATLGSFMLRAYKLFNDMMVSLKNAEIDIELRLSDGQRFDVTIPLSASWVDNVCELSAFLTNLCMHDRLLQNRYARILGK